MNLKIKFLPFIHFGFKSLEFQDPSFLQIKWCVSVDNICPGSQLKVTFLLLVTTAFPFSIYLGSLEHSVLIELSYNYILF